MAADGSQPLESVARPKQARSEQTLKRLLDAAEAMLAERRWSEVSIADIVRRAKSSVGGFYGRFRDKDELLLALHERFVRDAQQRMDELGDPARWEGATLEDIVRACFAEALRVYRERGPFMATFVAQAVHHREIAKAGLAFRQRVIDRFAEVMLLRREEIAHPHPERAVELGAQLAFALLDQSLVFGAVTVGGERIGDAELADELSRNLLSYLGRE